MQVVASACEQSEQSEQSDGSCGQLLDLIPEGIESWVDDGKHRSENTPRAKLEDVREQYERQLNELKESCGAVMLDRQARVVTVVADELTKLIRAEVVC